MSDLMPQDLIETDSDDSSNSQESAEPVKQKGGRKALSPELFAQSPIDAYRRLCNLFSAIGVSDITVAQSIVSDAFNWQLGTLTQSLEEQFALLPDEMKRAFLAKIGVQSGEPAKPGKTAAKTKPTIASSLSVE